MIKSLATVTPTPSTESGNEYTLLQIYDKSFAKPNIHVLIMELVYQGEKIIVSNPKTIPMK